ncbi:cell envelope integrity protein TolA [Aliiglaciecola litoralis]|uniref:Cell division and transport-associated protein TolA n=1 Tax=Aliiglaciecola litoralis TaxID=582857 RepID=A0ABP3WQP4_9ALTE
MLKFGPEVFISIGLHVLIGGLLLVSMNFSSPVIPVHAPMPNFTPIEAVVVDAKTINDQLQRIEDKKQAERDKILQQQRDEQRRKEEAIKRKQEQERKRVAEVKRREQAKKEEEQRQQRELERRAAEERERKAQQKREAEQRAKQEAQRKEQERKEMERLMQEQLQAEQAELSLRARQRQQYVLTETQKYQAMIEARIIQNWYKDDSMIGKTCRIQIRLSSTGFVISVRSLGGDKNVCVSGEQAVRRAGEMPMSKDPSVYNELKDITFLFKL